MINVRPGFWDVDRCAWVGVDPMHLMPPLRHSQRPHDRVPGTPDAPVPPLREPEPAPVDG